MVLGNRRLPSLKGAAYGLTAALLFGLSMPLAKQLLADIQPFLLAGLLYMGAGLGLAAWKIGASIFKRNPAREARITRANLPTLTSAILFGGIIAELLLMYGLDRIPASEASLLLNLEGAFAAAIAWVVFREHANKQVVLGMVLLTAGALVLSIGTNWQIHITLPVLCVVAACLCWGLDNNLTRKISHLDPTTITMTKGLVAGVVNVSIGLAAGGSIPNLNLLAASLLIGLLSYGVSLILYILALREIGTARSSAYFSAAPFIGAIASIIYLHEPIEISLTIGGLLMAAGIYLHLTENHDHLHHHDRLEHNHAHVHDAHHQHAHNNDEVDGEPHAHFHSHESMTHDHPHQPDIHHQHKHPH